MRQMKRIAWVLAARRSPRWSLAVAAVRRGRRRGRCVRATASGGRQLERRRRERPGEVRAGEGLQVRLHPQADRHRGVRPGERRRQGGRAGAPGRPRPSSSARRRPTTACPSQIDTVTNAATQGAKGVMISNCAGDQIEPAVKQASDAGAAVVAWDSPIPSGEGESVFVAQVDFDETGTVMADLALDILGAGGRRVRDPLGRARRREPERLDQVPQGGDQGPEVQEPQARRHRLRQRRLREVLRRGPRPGRQAPEPQADHGPDDRGHRRGGQGHDGREAVRQGEGVRASGCPRR